MRIGRVYKIITSNSNEIYVGSTFNELRFRWAAHKKKYGYWKDEITNKTSSFELFEKYGIENCKIILIKEYEVVDKYHLRVFEQIWINKLRPINKNNPFCIQRFYRRDKYVKYLQQNPDYNKKKYQKNLQNNPDFNKKQYQKALEKNPNYCKNKYQRKLELHPDYHKEQYQKALEKNPDHNKQHYQKQLQKNSDYYKEKIVCECGLELNKSSHTRHKRTKKHTDRMS